jgi:hypothetical protein
VDVRGNLLHPTVIERSAADVRVAVQAIRAAVQEAHLSERQRWEKARAAGQALIEAKRTVVGKWVQAVELSGADMRRVQELMQVAEHYSEITRADGFSHEMSVRQGIAHWTKCAKSGASTSAGTSSSTSTNGEPKNHEFSSGNNSTYDGDRATDDANGLAADANVPGEEQLLVPERYRAVLDSQGLFKTAAKKAKQAAEAIKRAEESPAYKALEQFETIICGKRNLTKHVNSGDWFLAARHFEAIEPEKLCPDCKGVEASQDADLCVTCGGKGFLVHDEVDDA